MGDDRARRHTGQLCHCRDNAVRSDLKHEPPCDIQTDRPLRPSVATALGNFTFFPCSPKLKRIVQCSSNMECSAEAPQSHFNGRKARGSLQFLHFRRGKNGGSIVEPMVAILKLDAEDRSSPMSTLSEIVLRRQVGVGHRLTIPVDLLHTKVHPFQYHKGAMKTECTPQAELMGLLMGPWNHGSEGIRSNSGEDSPRSSYLRMPRKLK